MTNLETQTKRQVRWPIIVIVVAVIVWLAAIILRLLTPASSKQAIVPTTPFVTTNYNNSTTVYNKVTFTGKEISVPATFSVATFQNAENINEQHVIDKIVAQYNLKQSTQVSQVWQGPQYAMTYDQDNQRYNLHKIISTTDSQKTFPKITNFDQTTQVAQSFINSLLPGLNLKPAQDSFTYFNNGPESIEVSKDQAELVNIKFYYLIDNLPILYAKKSDPSFDVTVDAQNTLLSMTFYPQFINFQIIGTRASIPIEKALSNIQNNQAAIVNVQNYKTAIDLKSLNDVTLDSVTLEYRADDTSKLVYPFYHFRGQATDSFGDRLNIQVITPAVTTANP